MYMKENTIIYAQQAQRIGQSSPLSIILSLCHHDGTLFYLQSALMVTLQYSASD